MELKPGESILALKNVTYNEPFFTGHFPGLKLMPGVLIVEALAQAGGILLYHSLQEPEKVVMVLSKIEEVKFRKPVVPGDQLKLSVQMLRQKAGFFYFSAQATVEGEVAVEGRLTAGLMRKNNPDEGR